MGNGCTSHKAVQTIQAPSLPPLKIVFVGESAVGKTSIIERYQKHHFLDKEYEPTKIVNIVSVVKKVNIPDQGIATLELWDTPGHEDVNMRKTHYLNADAVVVVFDISDPDSMDGALDWKHDVSANIRHTIKQPIDKTKENSSSLEQYKPKPGSIPVLLLGNKFDVAKENYLREQYTTYDMLGSKVTFNPLVKTNSEVVEESSPVDVVPSKVENPTPDTDTDQGIVIDNNEEEKEVQKQQEKPESTGEEDQGIVADKEDTPSSKTDSSDREETPSDKDKTSDKKDTPTSNPDSPENTQSSDGAADSSEVIKDKTSQEQDVVPGETSEVSASVENPTALVKKKSVDSGVINYSEDGSKADDEINKKPKKLKKIFPKDLLKQEENVEHIVEEKLEEKQESEKQNVETGQDLEVSQSTEETPVITEGSVITNLSVLPPCVDALESFTAEHGFISGIPVSAKDSKGGVQEALQSLVRHLVAKRKESGSQRKLRIDEMSVKSQLSAGRRRRQRHTRKTGSLEFEPLQEVGIIEIDETLRKCNPVLQQAEVMTTTYREAVHDFKRACYKHHLVEGNSISIEECVSAVKEAVQAPPKTSNEKSEIRAALLMQDYRPSFSVVAEDEDNFIKLNIVDGNGEVIDFEDIQESLTFSKEARIVLHIYHEKVFTSCTSVLESGFELEQILSQFCDQLTSKEEKAWDMAVAAGRSQTTVRHILSGLAQDKARLRGTLEQVKETRRSVNAIRARIRAALLF